MVGCIFWFNAFYRDVILRTFQENFERWKHVDDEADFTEI